MRRRTGFTIVELLVSMALIIFIMAILSEAFSAGFKSFRDLKALGEMNERLRTAGTTLRKYLSADHFEGRKRLSDPNFWDDGPPREGFFRIEQDLGSTIPEGGGSTLVNSYRSAGHRLHFTVKLRGNNRGDFFPASYAGATNSVQLAALLPLVDGYRDVPGTYHAQWLEVQVFLRPSEIAVSESGTTPGQLYALYLRTKALIPEDRGGATIPADIPVGAADRVALADFSLYNAGANYLANTPADVTIPERRSPFQTLGQEDPNRAGADVLLTDVLSMNVRVLVQGGNDFMELSEPALDGTWPQRGAGTPAVFDTWSQNSQLANGLPDYGGNPSNAGHWTNTIPRYRSAGGTPIRIKALQLQLRVWDQKTEQTRQTTLIIDL